MDNVEIMSASVDDADLLTQISFQSKRYWGYPEEWIESWTEDLTISQTMIQDNYTLKLVLKGKTIGFCIICDNEDYFEVEHCWILPAFIGKGFGKKLLSKALSRSLYANRVFKVLADPNAVPFYAKFGFKTVEQIPSQIPGRSLPMMEMINS